MCIGMYELVHACSRMYVLVYVCVCVFVHITNSLFQALYMYVFVCLFANTQLKCNREYNFKGTPLRYIHIFANTCIYINILYPYNHIRTYTYIYVHLYLDVFRTFRHQYVLIHTYTYVYIHIHDTHTCIYWQILPDTFTYKYTRTHTRVYVYTRQRTTGSRGSARHCQWVLGRPLAGGIRLSGRARNSEVQVQCGSLCRVGSGRASSYVASEVRRLLLQGQARCQWRHVPPAAAARARLGRCNL